VETHVREIDLHKVDARQQVQVRVDAYPELRLSGSVVLIGALAQSDAALAGAKLFPVTVALSTADARLRPGMTARVEIEVASLPATLSCRRKRCSRTTARYGSWHETDAPNGSPSPLQPSDSLAGSPGAAGRSGPAMSYCRIDQRAAAP
jgi:hypothetical protein